MYFLSIAPNLVIMVLIWRTEFHLPPLVEEDTEYGLPASEVWMYALDQFEI